MPARNLRDYSTDELHYELLRLTRREQWEADPIRFGREVFSQHFTRTPAAMHRAMLQAATGQAERSDRVGESPPLVKTSLPYPPPVSPQILTPSPTHA